MNVQDLIEHKKDICNLAKKLGFVNLRVFKGVTESEERMLNILADLDPDNNGASFIRLPLLENELEKNYGCAVSVALKTTLQDFYKKSILENCVQLEGDDFLIAEIYGGNAMSFIFEPTGKLIDEFDELEKDTLETYNEQASKIMKSYDEEVVVINLKKQIACLSLEGQQGLLSWLSSVGVRNSLSSSFPLLKYKG